MKDHPLIERLREASWRRALNPEEEAELAAWLRAHPEAQFDWETEAALNAAFHRLRSPEVSSNFTARVIEAALRQTGSGERRPQGWLGRLGGLRWLPKVAVATVVVGAGLFTYHEAQHAKFEHIGESLVTISEVPSFANPEILKDFEAIELMGQTPKADEDLLRLMQ